MPRVLYEGTRTSELMKIADGTRTIPECAHLMQVNSDVIRRTAARLRAWGHLPRFVSLRPTVEQTVYYRVGQLSLLGHTRKEIAKQLDLSPAEVRVHLARFIKMHVLSKGVFHIDQIQGQESGTARRSTNDNPAASSPNRRVG